jgi:hypothetical protein
MRERKLRSGVNWQGALKQKVVKQRDVKKGTCVLMNGDVKVFECLNLKCNNKNVCSTLYMKVHIITDKTDRR